MQENVKKIGDERLTKVPADLDTKPYRDEHDMELLVRMSAGVEKGHAPEEFQSARVRRSLAHALEHAKARQRGFPKPPTRPKARPFLGKSVE